MLCSLLLLLLAVATAFEPTAVVVGAGPAGLATALVLSQHHGYRVQVIDESKQTGGYESTRAYFYNINQRGQVWTKQFPKIQKSLQERGVGIRQFERLTVPGDPKEIFTNVPFSRPMSDEEKSKIGTFFWIPRHDFVNLILEQVQQDPNISVHSGCQCQRICPSVFVSGIRVDTSTSKSFVGNLVVGADGLNSRVRECLADAKGDGLLFQGWAKNFRPSHFKLRKWKTPSVGLRAKTLQLQPNFLIPVGDGTMIPLNGTANYAIRSVNTGTTDQISMIVLPLKNATAIRPCVICTLPNHDIWTKISSGAEMKAFFAKAFPRFDFDKTGPGCLVAEDEWERFTQSPGTTLPYCQYSPGHVAVSGSDESSGVVLVGDALHAFPPDTGQGVNAALGDVAVLDECLKAASSLGKGLQEYERVRSPETRALIRLARFCAPYQYIQPSRWLVFRRQLWTFNVAIRLLLNKLSSGKISNPAMLLMMDSQLSFRQVMKRADAVTVSLWSILAVAVWKLLLGGLIRRLFFS